MKEHLKQRKNLLLAPLQTHKQNKKPKFTPMCSTWTMIGLFFHFRFELTLPGLKKFT